MVQPLVHQRAPEMQRGGLRGGDRPGDAFHDASRKRRHVGGVATGVPELPAAGVGSGVRVAAGDDDRPGGDAGAPARLGDGGVGLITMDLDQVEPHDRDLAAAPAGIERFGQQRIGGAAVRARIQGAGHWQTFRRRDIGDAESYVQSAIHVVFIVPRPRLLAVRRGVATVTGTAGQPLTPQITG